MNGFKNLKMLLVLGIFTLGSCSLFEEFTATPFPKRNGHSSVVLNGALYVIGGIDGTNPLNDVWKSSDGGASWTQVATGARFPERSSHSSVVLNNEIYVIGGYNGFRASNDVWKSSDGGASWTQVTAAAGFPERSTHSSVVRYEDVFVTSDIYVIGGRDPFNGTIFDDVWKSIDGGASWTQVATGTKFPARYAHSSAVLKINEKEVLYVIGGRGASVFSDVWRSLNGENWTRVSDGGFRGRYAHSSAVLGNSIYIMGGYANGLLNDVWKSHDGRGENWTQQ